ncbi:hypothetical protein E3N88_31631 [Mikania micrantha]|uniref:Uncharacterized protein n=1 Tax=Mikania micrantha TaxID=192012 RepID=A0A5N6M6J3_9ASTR|nr:hypothetical protein E3N88_31631 [Mikania micrantha]
MIQESVKRLLHRVNNEDNHTREFPPSIYMAPSVLRDLSPSSFNPRLVSIGPLHREDENVKAFEGQKVSYLINLMSYINSPQEEILESCMQKAYCVMNEIKGCYIWTKTFTDAEIAEMMVLDACFIIGFIIDEHVSYHKKTYVEKQLQYRTIMNDMVLLENQIPLFFLDQMFQCTVLKFNSNVSFIELIKPVLNSHKLFQADLKFNNISFGTNDHFLSLLHQCYMPPARYIIKKCMSKIIHSAIDLDRAGVNFKPSKDPTWVMDMEVKQNQYPCDRDHGHGPQMLGQGEPTRVHAPNLTRKRFPVCFNDRVHIKMGNGYLIHVPEWDTALSVHDSTELLFRNLIAYEQSFPTQCYVSSYAFVMDMLVNTQEDVAKLVESKVLVNIMSSNEEDANMINKICKNVIVSDSYYEEEWGKLINYCNGYWPKHIAKMRSTYFSSPWSIIALVAGIILFVLQALQTIFTIKH